MSVSMFTNALRTHSRLRALTAARVALPATRSISSLVAFRTAVPKNVSLSESRSFTTSQVARNEYDDYAAKAAANTTIFVANIPWSASEDDLAQVFAEFGQVNAVRMHFNSDGRPRGIAHIDFATKDSANAAIESASQEPIHLAGRDLRVDFSAGNRAQAAPQPSEKLYFSGSTGEESDIRDLFREFNDSIIDIHLLRDPNTAQRFRTGFIHFKDIETATSALESLQGVQTPEGTPLSLSYARPRKFSPGFQDPGSRQDSRPYGRMRASSPRWGNGR